jgi:hypothetical protein
MMRRTLEAASEILHARNSSSADKKRASLRVLECSFGLLKLLEVALKEREERQLVDTEMVP